MFPSNCMSLFRAEGSVLVEKIKCMHAMRRMLRSVGGLQIFHDRCGMFDAAYSGGHAFEMRAPFCGTFDVGI